MNREGDLLCSKQGLRYVLDIGGGDLFDAFHQFVERVRSA